MPDFAALLKDTGEWRELSQSLSLGRAPQSLLVVLPAAFARAFGDCYARLLLCRSGTGDDDCDSCRAWAEDGHPDLVIAGTWDKAPGIEDCLTLNGQLSLHPVVAPYRLAVVTEADALSLPAANSLLKLTEEPPPAGRILFLAEQDNLIPTIRSRVWTIHFRPEQDVSAVCCAPPNTAGEWSKWFEESRKKTAEGIALEAEGWVVWLMEQGRWEMAASLRNVLFVAQKRHLPVAMVQDALFVLLKEGIKGEQLFGDLREA